MGLVRRGTRSGLSGGRRPYDEEVLIVFDLTGVWVGCGSSTVLATSPVRLVYPEYRPLRVPPETVALGVP